MLAVLVSCPLAGCDSDPAASTPEQKQGTQDALKKWQDGHGKPAVTGSGGSSAADVLKKKR